MKKVFYSLTALTCSFWPAQGTLPSEPNSLESNQKIIPFKAKDYSRLIGLPGFSDEALRLHIKLYEGYVKNTNLMLDLLKQYAHDGQDRSPAYAEIKRRLMWEYDGIKLHELYFDNLGKSQESLDSTTPLYKELVKQYDSFETWKKDFMSTGAIRGIGWAVLYYDPATGRLINAWINEHDLGHLAGGTPLLIMDVFEHAYLLDFGIDRAKYIDAFFNNINWDVVSKRYVPKV